MLAQDKIKSFDVSGLAASHQRLSLLEVQRGRG
jgi:hypothetical protein